MSLLQQIVNESKLHTKEVFRKLEKLSKENPNHDVWLSNAYFEYDKKTNSHYLKQDMGIVPDQDDLTDEEFYQTMGKIIGRSFTILKKKTKDSSEQINN